jgi:predicted RNA-binding Zn ribbon-like protein
MRKQQQAPGVLEVVRAFVNTRELDAGTDEFDEPARLRDWLSEHGLAPGDVPVKRSDLERAVRLRESLRAVLMAHNDGIPAPPEATQTLDEIASRARLQLRFDEHGGAAIEPAAEGVAGALGRLLTVIHAAMAEGTWERLKACRDHACEWAFYDHTKNRSGTWCTMEVCGNRAKARSYRERRTATTAP